MVDSCSLIKRLSGSSLEKQTCRPPCTHTRADTRADTRPTHPSYVYASRTHRRTRTHLTHTCTCSHPLHLSSPLCRLRAWANPVLFPDGRSPVHQDSPVLRALPVDDSSLIEDGEALPTGSLHESCSIKGGVPQGSVIGRGNPVTGVQVPSQAHCG